MPRVLLALIVAAVFAAVIVALIVWPAGRSCVPIEHADFSAAPSCPEEE